MLIFFKASIWNYKHVRKCPWNSSPDASGIIYKRRVNDLHLVSCLVRFRRHLHFWSSFLSCLWKSGSPALGKEQTTNVYKLRFRRVRRYESKWQATTSCFCIIHTFNKKPFMNSEIEPRPRLGTINFFGSPLFCFIGAKLLIISSKWNEMKRKARK